MFVAHVAIASAQEEPCHAVLQVDELREALAATESALADLQVDRAGRILADVIDVLRCVEEPLAPDDLGRLARHVALVAFYDADQAELRSWTWLERDTVGGPWPQDALPVPEAFHALRAELTEPPLVTLDAGWVAPKGGAVLVDGRPSERPAARSEVMHLVQVLDKRGAVDWSGWVLGAAVPERWVAADAGPLTTPRWLGVPDPPAPWENAEVAAVADGSEPPDEADPTEVVEAAPVRRTTEFMEIFPECPWRLAPNKVDVDGTTVKVNRFEHPARSDEEVAALQAVFRSCGEFRAARRLGRWSEARGKLFGGKEAKLHREAMIRVLLADEPSR